MATHPRSRRRLSLRVRRLQEIEACGSEVLVLSADVADERAMQEAIDRACAHFGRIDAVIHVAGNVGADGFFAVMRPVVTVANSSFGPRFAA